MQVFKILLATERKLRSITSLGKRIRYSTKRVNVPPAGYDEHLYSFKTLYFAKEFLKAFGLHSTRKFVIYEAVAITPLRDRREDNDRGFVLSRKLKLVKRVHTFV